MSKSLDHTGSLSSWNTVHSGPLAGVELLLIGCMPISQAILDGTHDDFMFKAVKGRLEGAVCWDIGAHIGYHTLMFAHLVGDRGKVVAFEPNPANHLRLQQNLGRNPQLASRTHVLRLALSSRKGTAEFRFSNQVETGQSSGSHLATAAAPEHPSAYADFMTAQVETQSIDALLASGEVPVPSILKIDVEGAEHAVLEGGRIFLRTNRPLLLLEIHHILQMMDVQRLLTGLGYKLQVLDPEHVAPGRCFVIAEPLSEPQTTEGEIDRLYALMIECEELGGRMEAAVQACAAECKARLAAVDKPRSLEVQYRTLHAHCQMLEAELTAMSNSASVRFARGLKAAVRKALPLKWLLHARALS